MKKTKLSGRGIIDTRRPLILVTDINRYGNRVTGTIDEILWLTDNGYTFRPNPHDISQTLAIPPRQTVQQPQITNYFNGGHGSESNERVMLRRFRAIKATVLAQRRQIRAQQQPQTTTQRGRLPGNRGGRR